MVWLPLVFFFVLVLGRDSNGFHSFKPPGRDTSSGSCRVSLPHQAYAACKSIRQDDLQKAKTEYQLSPSPLGLFPVINLSSEELTNLLKRDPLQAEWMNLYKGTITRNLGLGFVYLNRTRGLEFTSEAHYKSIFNFMVKSQYRFIPPQYHKFFRFHFLRPGKPFRKLTNLCNWREDKLFTDQRLASMNPMSIQRVSLGTTGIKLKDLLRKLNRRFDWKSTIQDALGRTMSVTEAAQRGLLYVVQYPYYDDIPSRKETSVLPGRRIRDAVSPIALFVSRPSRGRRRRNKLIPVAIQMGHTPDSPVHTPDDPDMWLLAKQTVQVADFSHGQTIEHLLKTHLFMEPICVCVYRHLHRLHPIHQLVKYHCHGILGTNKFGLPYLINNNGTMERLYAVGYEGAKIMLGRALSDVTWETTDFIGNIKKRGMHNKWKVPYFPYRDDGRLIYDAIKNLVDDYIDLYYQRNSDVIRDHELQDFANEVSAEGRLPPYGGNGKISGFPFFINDKNELKDIITRLIWMTSAQHSAVNYPGNYYGAYTPSMPTKLYMDPRVDPREFALYNLPGKYTATFQSVLSMTLTSMHYNTLFDYGKQLDDPKAIPILEKHNKWMNMFIRHVIEARNKWRYEKGHLPYPYLIPGWIANSIHT